MVGHISRMRPSAYRSRSCRIRRPTSAHPPPRRHPVPLGTEDQRDGARIAAAQRGGQFFSLRLRAESSTHNPRTTAWAKTCFRACRYWLHERPGNFSRSVAIVARSMCEIDFYPNAVRIRLNLRRNSWRVCSLPIPPFCRYGAPSDPSASFSEYGDAVFACPNAGSFGIEDLFE